MRTWLRYRYGDDPISAALVAFMVLLVVLMVVVGVTTEGPKMRACKEAGGRFIRDEGLCIRPDALTPNDTSAAGDKR